MSDGAPSGGDDLPGSGSARTGSRALLRQRFTAADVTARRHALTSTVVEAERTGQAEDFVPTAHELMTNAVRHGGGSSNINVRMMADVLPREIVDHGDPCGKLPCGCPRPTSPAGVGCGWRTS